MDLSEIATQADPKVESVRIQQDREEESISEKLVANDISTSSELELHSNETIDCTLPVLASCDYKLRWNDKAIQFETADGMRHLEWKDAVDVRVAEITPEMTFFDRTIDIKDRNGLVHKIPLMYVQGKDELNELFDVARSNSNAAVWHLPRDKYEAMSDCVIKLWSHNDSDPGVKDSKRIVNAVVSTLMLGWMYMFYVHATHRFLNFTGYEPALMQMMQLISLGLLPLYPKLLPISQIRMTPSGLRCEAVVGKQAAVKKKIAWRDLTTIELSPEKANQRSGDRQLCFNFGNGGSYKIKLEAISTSQSWKQLLRGLDHYSGLSVEGLDPNIFDKINPDRNDPTYTQIWLDSLTAPPQRDKLVPLQAGIALQNAKYILARKLGGGGQGTAYLAHTADGTTVVLKEYILPVFVDAKVRRKALENFKHEARMLQQLNSPLIVRLRDFFVEDHRGYLVLEHIDGPNLRDYVQTQGPLSEDQTIEYGIYLCDVLTHLHSQEPPIIHRDFTPDNVIVCADDTLKVIDFMVAQRNDETATATVVGKQAYIPPEQFRGKATQQSDIYALGCSLFFLLTGQDPEPLSSSNPALMKDTVSSTLDQIVAKATAVEPDERFKSAAELKQTLQAARSEAS